MEDEVSGEAHFVSTNSITQGEQVGVLWPDLFQLGVKIHFAHRTFQWMSEAKGKAAVHCVIIGFGLQEAAHKTIFVYADGKGEPHAMSAHNINPYLVDAPDVVLKNRSSPICKVPIITEGSALIDDGHLLFSIDEAEELRQQCPVSITWLRPFYSGGDFLNGGVRYCLWLEKAAPSLLRSCPSILERIERVRDFRQQSQRAATSALAATPSVFGEIRQPKHSYIFIPKTSSESRLYIPFGFMNANDVLNNTSLFIEDANFYHFGVLTSIMHNAWMRTVCGRLKSDYRYSAGIVYNNFPWPDPTDAQRVAIEAAAQAVLDVRAGFMLPSPASGRGAGGEGERASAANSATLADLYDPLAMPPQLSKAHQVLDRAVDAAYGKARFASEAERVAFLFALYQQLTSLLPAAAIKPSRKRSAEQMKAV